MDEINPLKLRNWLAGNSYRYSVFVSWPSNRDPKVEKIVEKLKKEIEGDALNDGLPPHVFVSSEIGVGEDWQGRLSRALCESLTLVAICGPEYYASDWCGREWAGMETRGSGRIVPLVLKPWGGEKTDGLRQIEILPPQVQALEYRDLSRELLHHAAPWRSPKFKAILRDTMSKALEVATSLARAEEKPDCDRFSIPARSAFEEYRHRQVFRPYPLLTEPR
jgi:hypothetical protein